MIKRRAMTAIGMTVTLAMMIGCESTGERTDRAGSQIEDRGDEELEKGTDKVLDRVFEDKM